MPSPLDLALTLLVSLGALSAVAVGVCLGGPRRSRPVLAGAGPVRLGPYLLGGQLGAGGMGRVFRARHVVSGEWRALKLLAPDAGPHAERQFEREAELGALLRHPNVVALHEHGRAANGTRYLAMDLLEGITLEQLVQRDGALPPSRVLPLLVQLCAALAATHARGLVHRDIKPGNIVLCRGPRGEDVIKLLDFGLARRLTPPAGEAGAEPQPVVGTPLYLSPEAITAPDAVDARSDLYGVGAVAHFLLSGRPVFGGHTVLELCSQHLLAAPEPLSRSARYPVDPELEQLVLECLAKDPAARPPSASALARRLQRRVERPRRARCRPRRHPAQLSPASASSFTAETSATGLTGFPMCRVNPAPSAFARSSARV